MPRYCVELLGKSDYTRFILIDLPEGAPLDHGLPWGAISNAVDQMGLKWKALNKPYYEHWQESGSISDLPIVTVRPRDSGSDPTNWDFDDFIVADTQWPDPSPADPDSDTTA